MPCTAQQRLQIEAIPLVCALFRLRQVNEALRDAQKETRRQVKTPFAIVHL